MSCLPSRALFVLDWESGGAHQVGQRGGDCRPTTSLSTIDTEYCVQVSVQQRRKTQKPTGCTNSSTLAISTPSQRSVAGFLPARTHITRKRHDGTHHPNHQCWWWHGRLKAKRQPFVASPNQRRRMPGARAVRPSRALKKLVLHMCDVAFGCSPCQGSLQHARPTHFSKEMRRREEKKNLRGTCHAAEWSPIRAPFPNIITLELFVWARHQASGGLETRHHTTGARHSPAIVQINVSKLYAVHVPR